MTQLYLRRISPWAATRARSRTGKHQAPPVGIAGPAFDAILAASAQPHRHGGTSFV